MDQICYNKTSNHERVKRSLSSTDIVICGAGIAGISAAYELAVRHGEQRVVLIDPLPPLTLTSSQSTECYRNWWPGPGEAMVALMNRSIDLLEELAVQTNDAFNLTRRGYLYVSADDEVIARLHASALEISTLGAGRLRVYRGLPGEEEYIPAQPYGFTQGPDGADLILDTGLLQEHFPYLNQKAKAGLHVRRAGWFSGQQMGMILLDQALRAGVQLVRGSVAGVEVRAGRVQAIYLEDGSRISTQCFVNAAGPMLQEVGRMLGLELPVFNERHLKLVFKDVHGVIPRHAPLLIWSDSQRLPWLPEERKLLSEDDEAGWLLAEFPPGVHTRPEGGEGSSIALMLWGYHPLEVEPAWPIPIDPDFPEVVLRGLSTMIPGLQAYFNHAGRPMVDGGYYTKTRENRPLIGPLPIEGAYVFGALSGFGLMAACGAGELLALCIEGKPLPNYASAFRLDRYQDPEYLQMFEARSTAGQL